MIRGALLALLAVAAPGVAGAQGSGNERGRPWVVVGGTFTTVLGDCPDCAEDFPESYRHTGGFLANVGVSLNRRTDVGGELFWVPSTARTGDEIRTTFVLAAVQFRPWTTSGFFLKTGAGMAFVRNWVVDLTGGNEDPTPPFTSKAFALNVGAGWEWRVAPRIGVQLFGTQHVAALGDLETSVRKIENVVGNFWSLGGGITFR